MTTEEIDSQRLEAAETRERQDAEPLTPPTFGGRYRVERELKRALAVRTLLATDLDSALAVVVKTTPVDSLSPAARIRLGHEAQTLVRLRDPAVAPLLGMGREAGWALPGDALHRGRDADRLRPGAKRGARPGDPRRDGRDRALRLPRAPR